MVYWTIEFTTSAQKELGKLDRTVQKRIMRYLDERVKPDPSVYGIPMTGDKAGMWRYRVGDYRVVVEQHKDVVKVIIIRVGHRKNVYDF